jgi:hypothetical protein
MFTIENVTINGHVAYFSDGYLHTNKYLNMIKVKNNARLKNVSFTIGGGMRLELDNVTMTDVSFEIYRVMPLTKDISEHPVIRDVVISESICIYRNLRTPRGHNILMDKSFCIESNITNTRLVNSRVHRSTITSKPNSSVLNTVTILKSKIGINRDLYEKFILEASQFKESYEIMQKISSGERWYVTKKYDDKDAYIIRRLYSDGEFTGVERFVKRSSINKVLKDGWVLVRDRMTLTYEGISGIHSGLKPEKRVVMRMTDSTS